MHYFKIHQTQHTTTDLNKRLVFTNECIDGRIWHNTL